MYARFCLLFSLRDLRFSLTVFVLVQEGGGGGFVLVVGILGVRFLVFVFGSFDCFSHIL